MSHSTETDYQLLQRIQRGDTVAFRQLYERHGLALLKYIMGIVGTRQLSEDVLQDVMLVVWQQADTFRPTGAVRGWIFGIARRQALKAVRRHPPLPLYEDQHPSDGSLSDEVARRLTLKQAIAQLPAVEREALEMVYYRGMTLQDVADTLDVPLNTVKTRLYRARQRLRVHLTEEDPDHA